LVPYDKHVFGLCWGFGHLIIAPDKIEPSFGLRFAIRRANPEQVRSLTIHTMDTLARTARTTVPGGAALEAFGMAEIGELVSRLVGRIPAVGLTSSRGGNNDFLTVRGADGLNIPLSRTPIGLMSDLSYLANVIAEEDPVDGLEHFEHTRPLRPGDPIIESLKDRLAEALTSESGRVALSWPSEWEEEHGEADSYLIENLGKGDWDDQPDSLDLEHLTLPLAHRPPEARLAALKRIRIQAIDSDGNAISRAIPGDKWITFETDANGQRFVFHQGRWFNIGGLYLEMLRDKVEKIFSRKSSAHIPPWPKERKQKGNIGPAIEGNYNKYAARDPAFLCLDKKLLYTEQHPRGIEACDLLGPEMELIHVKRMDDSISASHLFNQAIVSAEALRRQPDARDRWREKVSEESNGARVIPADFRPGKVILAFGGREATPDALFTFSQVTLVRCAQRLGELEIDLEIAGIDESNDVVDIL
jgi:uncharacterized protein (TIGR04141 family)